MKVRNLVLSSLLFIAFVLTFAFAFAFSLDTKIETANASYAQGYHVKINNSVYFNDKTYMYGNNSDNLYASNTDLSGKVAEYDASTGTLTIYSELVNDVKVEGGQIKIIFECDYTGSNKIGIYTDDRTELTSTSEHTINLYMIYSGGNLTISGDLTCKVVFCDNNDDAINYFSNVYSKEFMCIVRVKEGDLTIKDNASLDASSIPGSMHYRYANNFAQFFRIIDVADTITVNTTGYFKAGIELGINYIAFDEVVKTNSIFINKCEGGFYIYSFLEDHITNASSNITSGYTSGIKGGAYDYTFYVEKSTLPKNIYFYGNGATSGTMSSQQTDANGDYVLPACAYERTNYKFVGWAYPNASSKPIRKPGSTINVDEDTSLFAVWAETTKAKVIYVYNGILQDDPQDFVDENTYAVGETVELKPGTIFTPPEGKIFSKWKVLYGTKVDDTHYTIKDDGEGNGDDIYVFPEWADDPNVWEITYDPDGGTGDQIKKYVTKDDDYKLIVNPYTAPTGKEFKCWYISNFGVEKYALDDITPNSNLNISAVWVQKESLTASFNDENPVPIGTKLDLAKVVAIFTLDDNSTLSAHYSELEFYINDALINVDTYEFAKGRHTVVVKYAQDNTIYGYMLVWVGYTVSVNVNGGTGEMADAYSWRDDNEFTLPACTLTAPTGQTFDGWEVNGGKHNAGETVIITGDTALKALWADITYTVSFGANGGTGTMTPVDGVNGSYTLPANGFTAPQGKKFKCWSVGGVEKAVGSQITVSENTTVTAVWEDIPAQDPEPQNPQNPEPQNPDPEQGGSGENGNNGNNNSNNNSENSISDNAKKPLGGGAIAGIVIACVVVLAGAGVGVFFLLKKKGIIGKK